MLHVRGSSYEQARRAGRALLGDGPNQDVEALVVVGGDGMVHLGVDIVAMTDVPLGIVATGTGNDIARHFGLPSRDAAAPPTSSTRHCPVRERSRRSTRSTPPARTAPCSPHNTAGLWPW